ncbi:MAG: class I SAM-dependent methyltransferase [Colwellia sp.]|nr:class I SAM-dependent methyltransferase [Colwellia sp.]
MNSKNAESPKSFNKDVASSYDKQFSKLAPMKDALHLCMQIVLSDLPSEANVLCVGVGTGAELIALAKAFPKWKFTAVEPAASMLNVFRQKADELGISERCTFHEGYLDSLPEPELFDAATSILVSQFIIQPEKRSEFFREIGKRLNPNGYIINADLAGDMAESNTIDFFDVWLRMLAYSGKTEEQVEQYRSSFGKNVAVLPRPHIEDIIVTGGFTAPILFCQTLFIHAWYSRLNSER